MPSNVILTAAIAGSGGIGSVIDLRSRRIPNWLTASTAALGLGLGAAHVDGLTLGSALAGGAIGLGLMLPGYLIAKTGAGDVKLMAAVGTMLGPKPAVLAFLYTAMVGGVFAVVVAVRRRRLRASLDSAAVLVCTGGRNVAEIENPSVDNRFAYAPAIAIGALVAVLGV